MKTIDLACIIDDDKVYVLGVKKMIALSNFCKNLMVFNNGEEALRYLKPMVEAEEGLPDVILLDINMPVMDGWQFLDEFVKIKPHMKKKITIYMMSSSNSPQDMERAKSYNDISSYFVKPLNIQDLETIAQADSSGTL